MQYICNICKGPTDDAHTIGDLAQVFHLCDACRDKIDREYDYQSAGETIQERTLVCPHCGHEYEDYDAYGFDEGGTDEVECEACGRKFDLEIECIRRYSTKRSLSGMPPNYGMDDDEGE